MANSTLHRHREFDEALVHVVMELEVIILELKEGLIGDLYRGQRSWRPLQLLLKTIEVIEIDMGIAKCMREYARGQLAFFGHHRHQERVARHIEGHAKGHVGRALIELAIEPAVDDVKLKHHMAWRKSHFFDVGHIPRADDDAPGIGVVFDQVDGLLDLVDMLAAVKAFVARLHEFRPASPLIAVYGTQLAAFISPRVPDWSVLRQFIINIGRAAQKPEELAQNTREIDLFGRQERKALTQVVFRLHAEYGDCSCAGAVFPLFTVLENISDQVQILLH